MKKSAGYLTNVAFLMVFDILISSGKDLTKVVSDEYVDFDIKKSDIYKAEKKLKEFVSNIQPFKNQVSAKVKKKVREIIADTITLSKSHEYLSPEILAIYLLYGYFHTYDHKKMPEDFKYFSNENNYYPILDRMENTKLININEVYKTTNEIIERNR